MGQTDVLNAFGDSELSLVHYDDHIFLDEVALFDKDLVQAWFLLFKEACDAHSSISGHPFEVGEGSDDVEHLFILLQLVLVHKEIQIRLV